MGRPLFTIITATYNCVDSLPRTLASIEQQDCNRYQWIVVDGASNDGTVELIKSNKGIISEWISEPDSGIYSAWNKALDRIKGEWVIFLGAGDILADRTTLSEVSEFLRCIDSSVTKLAYGKIVLVDVTGTHVMSIGEPWGKMKNEWYFGHPKLPVHPEVFHHFTIFSNGNKFDERFKIAADAKLLLQIIEEYEPVFIPMLITKMLTGGISSSPSNNLLMWREIGDIREDLNIKAPLCHLLAAFCKMKIKLFLYEYTPRKFYHYLLSNLKR